MTPCLSATQSHAQSPCRFPLWFPFLLVWLLLLPIVMLLTPAVFLACLVLGINPVRGIAVFWQLFIGLHGVRIVVEDASAPISIRIL